MFWKDIHPPSARIGYTIKNFKRVRSTIASISRDRCRHGTWIAITAGTLVAASADPRPLQLAAYFCRTPWSDIIFTISFDWPVGSGPNISKVLVFLST